MLSKQDQMKEAASLAEKITQSIISNLREHVGVNKKESDELKNFLVYDEVFDVVVESYRSAMCAIDERNNDNDNDNDNDD